MEIRCTPRRLSGTVRAVPSKSDAHRLLICAALADKPTVIHCSAVSKDIEATVGALRAMGAEITIENEKLTVVPHKFNKTAELDCGESGSTLRFLLPVLASLGINAKISAHGRLPERPLSPLKEEMERHGVLFGEGFPLTISGQLTAGEYVLSGNVSSQFISGLLFALPLLNGDSEIRIVPPFESKPYVDMTVGALKKFGVDITLKENLYIIKGQGKFCSPGFVTVEGDWSNSAFFLCAGALSRDGVTVSGLNTNSLQGDRKILSILKRMGADVTEDGDSVTVKRGKLFGTIVDASEIPDIVPIVSVMGALCDKGVTHIINAARLRLKESDRLAAVNDILTSVNAAVSETDDGLVVWGENDLTGGAVGSHNDHRIVMAAAVLSSECTLPLDISGAEAVEKSYPSFFEDFNSLGGKADVINNGK